MIAIIQEVPSWGIPPAPDIVIPKGRPLPGQYELFDKDSNTSK